MKPKLLFKNNKGICFKRVDNEDISRVRIQRDDHIFHEYFFRNTKEIKFISPYISWENLSCCGGWEYDKDYLKDAVQKNKKICSGISFKDAEEMDNYISNLDKNKYHYVDVSRNNGDHRFHLIDLVRKGKLSDYYEIDNIIYFYELLGLNWDDIDDIDVKRFNELFHSDLYDIINGSKNYKYNSIDKTLAEGIFTGLLLGYPLESTISILYYL